MVIGICNLKKNMKRTNLISNLSRNKSIFWHNNYKKKISNFNPVTGYIIHVSESLKKKVIPKSETYNVKISILKMIEKKGDDD